jgi:EF-P beta-lysylation protein EpmB
VQNDVSGATAQPGKAGTLAASSKQTSLGDWRRQLAEAVRNVDELWQILELPPEALPAARAATADFPLLATRSFLSRCRKGDLDDPLLAQVLPRGEELVPVPGFGTDPVGESLCSPTPGLLRKYQGRALLITTGACAVHCRYCFRRHYPYGDRPRGRAWWSAAVDELRNSEPCDEILLSGGDPLVLPDAELAALLADLADLPGLKRLRIHSRLPVVLPDRVTGALVKTLSEQPFDTVMVVHSNHGNEIDDTVRAAVRALSSAGIPVLNQAVLLRGINDMVESLLYHSERLIGAGIVPYYLHQIDPVAGAAHFAVPDGEAIGLMEGLRARASGYLVPRLVREIPGRPGKDLLEVPGGGYAPP